MQHLRSKGLPRIGAALMAVFLGQACGGDDTETGTTTPPTPETCAPERELGGACLGVPKAAVCEQNACTADVACTSVVEVAGPDALTGAAAKATAGVCLALAPGDYGDVSLPGGVSLLGKGAAFVRVHGVALGAGSGAVLRGVEVGAGGVQLEQAKEVRIDRVSVRGSAVDGVSIGAGSSVTLDAVEITGQAGAGVRAVDASAVTAHAMWIADGQGPGLWAACTDGCACASRPAVHLASVAVHRTLVIGIQLHGVEADLEAVDVAEGGVRQSDLIPAGGLSVSGCASVTAKSLRVLDNAAYGVLIDSATATLGTPGEADGVEIRNNLMGVWIQNLGAAGDQPVLIDGAVVEGNSGVGIGIDGSAKGIIIHASQIKGTKAKLLSALENGIAASKTVGDGVAWLGGSQVKLDGVTLGGNERASILIDGEVAAGSEILDATLSEGDEALGILQQHFPSGGTAPVTSGSTPTIAQVTTESFAIPIAPTAPAVE